MKKHILAIGFLGLTTVTPASSQTFATYGLVTSLFISGSGNFPFRVTIAYNGVNQLSQCTGSFGYLEMTDSNYEVKVAALMNSYFLKQALPTVYLNKDPVTGYCKISDFAS